MHRDIRDQIEDVLADERRGVAGDHLEACGACRAEVQAMREQAALMRELRAPAAFDAELRPGFYARVMERIEAEGAGSIWNLFIESAFGRRIAMASLALALVLGVYLVSSERSSEEPMVAAEQSHPMVSGAVGSEALVVPASVVPGPVAGEDEPGRVITQMDQSSMSQSSDDAVLANLVTYREQ